MEYNEHELGVGDMFRHDRFLHRMDHSTQNWLAATANDDISTVRDWIVAGLFGLA
uniref:Uncharacterized protein n=1 Tax=Arundo donax TaxID=35708 RepID=A0A0A9GTK5_ARUDO